MVFQYKDLNVSYECLGSGKRLILLHGWGGAAVWNNYLYKFIELGFQVFVISLPGFDQSDTPKDVVDSFFYADLVNSFVKELELEDFILMGHSLGGKVATIYQKKYGGADMLILSNSAGFKRFNPEVVVKVAIAKIGKFVLNFLGAFGQNEQRRQKLLSLFASDDYLESGAMKDSFKKIIGEDIRTLFKDIKIPSLIIWGDEDNQTPLIDGVEIQRSIQNSEIKIIKSAGHFPFISHTDTYFQLINEFVSKNEESNI
ncbi:alpha/beta hydrolase [Candidatus Dojkabacteria bacterium]|nr:alpha/beta hydrolase [Candidatus Dojkabacteria bacterium]